jgi:hypothetical protein
MSKKEKRGKLILEEEKEDSGLSCKTNLEPEFKILNCNEDNYYSSGCNKFLLKKELVERNCLEEDENDEDLFLYPNLNDAKFNIKIAEKKEFNDNKYDGTIHANVKEHADILANADFELSPHQAFVKNFLSFQTPYNSLLLYHGLGSGKTCSAIGVCEEMRDYLKQVGISKRIIIVASENVQDNFRLQLFDERKLKEVDGQWSIRGCVGNKLLKEINPMSMKGLSRDKVVAQIKALINSTYLFLGYGQFANYIIKTIKYNEETATPVKKVKKSKKGLEGEGDEEDIRRPMSKIETIVNLDKKMIQRLKAEFNNRLIVIDEVHNIRKEDDNKNKKVAVNLEILVKTAENMRLLFLSATPMYNNYTEIIWLLNIMNTNDRRGKISVSDVFDKSGSFKPGGEELLIRKATGYISFVRGENPYTFPYRVYPVSFSKQNTFIREENADGELVPEFHAYPEYQMNHKKIRQTDIIKQYLDNNIYSYYLNTIGNCNLCGECQACAYKYIIYNLRTKVFNVTTKKGQVKQMPSFENMESFGYTLLQKPLESLIISYPIDGLKQAIETNIKSDKYLNELEEDFFVETPEIEDTTNKIIVDLDLEKEGAEDIETGKEVKSKVRLGGMNMGGDGTPSSEEEEKEEEKEKEPGIFIDPGDLTGRRGLERMMTFVDSKSPPDKGKFEYKKQTIDKYGRIFSKDIIGKYSSKIKSIMEHIFSEESGAISEGILLIYSQYIDGGLIPVALALEEMGFTRYGKDTKNLFKTRPVEAVDVRTMKPPTNKKDFMPARYSMITGDPRLSPDNDYEVKGVTNENNKDGNRIKVILISKAGSEGIDLKFIRQVHILEPWYNMNLLEQVIGRAVRNFSHKDLPFEKRNVQIFMYGTLLDDDKEESADLYVYRIAGVKSIQIGKVSRLLKQTAVDCIINHDQTNFSQDILNDKIEGTITQELSTGLIIPDFKIGDAPFSAACDYLATCYYDCIPDKEINEEDLNEDTYNENYIVVNSDKIFQRIRMLMKERYFYKKDELIHLIQTPKEYPLVQVYYALTQLIEDNNEFIEDRFGRTGRLINIAEYYLFQPSELINKNASIFDRSVPIDVKHKMIKFDLKQNFVKAPKKLIIEDEIEEDDGTEEVVLKERKPKLVINKFINGKKVFDELNANYELSKSYATNVITLNEKGEEIRGPKKVDRGDDNWYKHSGVVIGKLQEDIPINNLWEFVVDHMIESLLFKDKVDLMNYIYSLESIQKESIEFLIKNYFVKNSIKIEGTDIEAIVLFNLNKMAIMILNRNNEWIRGEPEDERKVRESVAGKPFFDRIIRESYNTVIGFMGYEKNNANLSFKTKNLDSSRDTGARCDEVGKGKMLETDPSSKDYKKSMKFILGITKYTQESTKKIVDKDKNVIQEAVSQIELCIIEEFYMRYYNETEKNGLKWFLTPEMMLFHF